MSGFIRLERDAFEHPLLRDDKRFRAWFWMVAKACWKPHKFDISGKIIELQRGQFVASRNQLAKEWGWSPSAVVRFLTRLETEQMIGQATGQGRTIVTIRNYNKYNPIEAQTGQDTGQETGQAADKQRTAKEQGNKGTSKSNDLQPENVSDEVWADFVQHRKRKKAIITGRVMKAIAKQADLAGWSLQDALDEVVTRNWQTFKADWVEKREAPAGERKAHTPQEWLAICEERAKWAREKNYKPGIEMWERNAAIAREKLGIKIPNLKVVNE